MFKDDELAYIFVNKLNASEKKALYKALVEDKLNNEKD